MKNTVDLDDLLNAPLVINPDDEIKENDVVITKGVVTDDDLLNAPLVIDGNTDEETNIKTDIPEEHEVKEEKEKNIPPSQDTLYSRYKEKYPQLFQRRICNKTIEKEGINRTPYYFRLLRIQKRKPTLAVIFSKFSK